MTWWMRLGAAELRRHKLRTTLVGALVFVPVAAMVIAAVFVASATQPVGHEYIQLVGSDDCEPSTLQQDVAAPACDLDVVAGAVHGRVRHRAGTVGIAWFAGPSGRATGVELLELPDPEVIFGPSSRVVNGRFPQGPAEVALSPGQLDRLGVRVGDRVRFGVPDGRATVVGEVIVANSDVGLVSPGTLTAPTSTTDPTGAARRRPTAFVAVDDTEVGAVSVDPVDLDGLRISYGEAYGELPAEAGWDPVDVVPLVGGAALVWLTLVASTGLAIGARRRRRELGLLVVTGADPSQVRAAAISEGVVLGLAGSGLGLVCGLLVAVTATPRVLRRFDVVVDATVIPWPIVLVCAALGVLAAGVAGDLATRAIRRQTPLELLAEASLPPRPARRWFVLGAVLWAAAVAGLLLDRRRGFFAYEAEWSVRIAIGVLGAGGLVALVVGGIHLAGRVTRRLPFPWHLAGADLTRHGARVAAAAAAVSLTLVAGLGAAAAADGADPVPAGGEGGSDLALTLSRLQLVDGRLVESTVADAERLVTDLGGIGVDAVQLIGVPCDLPVCRFTSLAVPDPASVTRLPSSVAGSIATGLVVLPGHIEGFLGQPRELGGLEVRPTSTPGQVLLSVGHRTVRAVVDPAWQGQTLLPGPLVEELGLRADGEHTMALGLVRNSQVASINRVLRSNGVDELWDPVEADESDRRIALGAALAAGAVALLVATLALALVRAESVDEDRTLGILGAAPGRRRSVHAVRGALTMLAAGVPALVGAVLLAKLRMQAPGLGVPVWSVVLVALVLPLCAWLVNLAAARPRRWETGSP